MTTIKWRSKAERLACFDALITLAHRGCITVSIYHEIMEAIVGGPVWTHELGTEGIKRLRKLIEDGNE